MLVDLQAREPDGALLERVEEEEPRDSDRDDARDGVALDERGNRHPRLDQGEHELRHADLEVGPNNLPELDAFFFRGLLLVLGDDPVAVEVLGARADEVPTHDAPAEAYINTTREEDEHGRDPHRDRALAAAEQQEREHGREHPSQRDREGFRGIVQVVDADDDPEDLCVIIYTSSRDLARNVLKFEKETTLGLV